MFARQAVNIIPSAMIFLTFARATSLRWYNDTTFAPAGAAGKTALDAASRSVEHRDTGHGGAEYNQLQLGEKNK